ncbi:pyrroline-5-carboxylate reductase [Metasolibacillus meyeri]|uniref:Pyrroline-5-carboxylate reductase n=1 Tax=Metasolibacillus meyeri TaxID=1071052 RepID=A0AAW9NLB6_9BACL|nr:pyrroline-5-carboxylate reductase [Metasolibacillus meyeri]MEC1178185.1 pyrroline-5-carboxylate reductase [Metasolibacillus meyeri]
MEKIAFIGAGAMAEAIIKGWIDKGCVAQEQIYITNKCEQERLEELKEKYGVHILPNKEMLSEVDCIILATKPKDAKEAMASIAPFLSSHTAAFSVLAGIPIATIRESLGDRPIARIMPNTSATIGMSASGVTFNALVDEELRANCLKMLEAIGTVVEVEEEQLHAVTAFSGSGPAYIYYLLEAFEQVAEEVGLQQDVVRSLMVQTLAGAAAMVQTGNEEPAVLRHKVTSPGGTTEAGIRALEQHELAATIAACVKSATARSRELAKGI